MAPYKSLESCSVPLDRPNSLASGMNVYIDRLEKPVSSTQYLIMLARVLLGDDHLNETGTPVLK